MMPVPIQNLGQSALDRRTLCSSFLIGLLCLGGGSTSQAQSQNSVMAGAPLATGPSLGSFSQTALQAELSTVKLYGAGGFAGLDAFQSGMFISEQGHILTVWSTVLDVDTTTAVSSDGGRYQAKVLGIDPNLEIAVLATGERPSSYFDLTQAATADIGDRVLAFSNLFGIATGSEMTSLQKGIVMAKTDLRARRGSINSVYQGPVYVVDAMTNNPGAAGGALTNVRGQLVGMLGKELRDSTNNIWLNYALPIEVIQESVQSILDGKSIIQRDSTRLKVDRPTNLSELGVILVPNVLSKTPAFVDMVQPGSAAETAGLKSDDLILFVNSIRVSSQAALLEELEYIDRIDPLLLLVQRGNKLEQIDLTR